MYNISVSIKTNELKYNFLINNYVLVKPIKVSICAAVLAIAIVIAIYGPLGTGPPVPLPNNNRRNPDPRIDPEDARNRREIDEWVAKWSNISDFCNCSNGAEHNRKSCKFIAEAAAKDMSFE